MSIDARVDEEGGEKTVLQESCPMSVQGSGECGAVSLLLLPIIAAMRNTCVR